MSNAYRNSEANLHSLPSLPTETSRKGETQAPTLPDDAQRLSAIIATQQEVATAGLDLGTVLTLIAERTQAITGATGAAVELADGDELVYRAASGTAAHCLGLRLKMDSSLSGRCVRTGQALRCDDAETDERVDREACRTVGLRSMIVVPLHHNRQVAGVLKVLSPQPGAFSDRDVQTLQLMSGLLAAALSHAAAYEAKQSLVEELSGALRQSEERLRLIDQLRQADRHKDEFLAVLAHELRNPLAPVRNAVEIMRVRDVDDPGLRWARDIIDRQVQQMTRLVDDLLDVSRISRGKVKLQKEPVDLAAVVGRAVEISRPLVDARRHELAVTLPPEPVRLEADAARLAQVVANLLNNAAKYTEAGGQIWLSVERDDGEAVVRVRDTGVGIPAEMLVQVFDLFTQVTHSLDRSHGGLGIGLTLAKSLVEMHGGSVRAHSDGPGKGSEFVVRLPLLTPLRSEGSGPGVNGPLAESSARRILVVDGNVDAADSLAVLLRLMGNDVRTAHDGPAALEAARAYRPDVVLLDIGLPRMSGYEVCRRLREGHFASGPLVVALTGYGQDEDRRHIREAGFDRHLVKPVNPDELREVLAEGHGGGPERAGFGNRRPAHPLRAG
jgi:signal transduction histidine kinase/ActR/RegA family two-component response regulator